MLLYFIFDFTPGITLSGFGQSSLPASQGSRNGNLGLEDGTALRLWRQISTTYFRLAHCRSVRDVATPPSDGKLLPCRRSCESDHSGFTFTLMSDRSQRTSTFGQLTASVSSGWSRAYDWQATEE